MPRRLEDWPERLAQFLSASLGQPFLWGQRDCALFACDAVREITGEDCASDFRGRYSDAAGALRAMRAFLKTNLTAEDAEEKTNGFDSTKTSAASASSAVKSFGLLERVCAAVARARGLAEISPRQAQRGDLVLIETETCRESTRALGVVALDGRVLAAGADGVVTVAIAAGRRAWRVV